MYFAQGRRRRVAGGGLGIYNYDAQVSGNIGKLSGYTWQVEAFGDVGDDALRTSVRNQIKAVADGLRANGAITDAEYSWMITGADNGILATPALTDAMKQDSFAKVAYYRMMNDTGLWNLRRWVREQVKKQVLEDAKTAAANVALWDSIGTTMEYVSGKKALDKLNEILGNIRNDVAATNEALAAAQATLTADRFALVQAEAKGIDGSISNLTKWVPGATEETGRTGLGAITAVAVVVAGVAIGIASICWAYVSARKTAVADKLAEMAEQQRQAEVLAAQQKKAAADAAVDAAVAAGKLTDDQGAALKLQSAEEAEVAVKAAGDKSQVAAKQAAETAKSAGGGFLGIDFKWLAIGGVALIGLMALPQIMSAIPKRRE